jgi:phage terminase large subunit
MNSTLAPSSQEKLKLFFQLGQQHGCPKDQLLNFSNAGIILQARQLAASAAARLCDQPHGPKAIGYGGARGGGKTHWLLAQLGADDCQRVPDLNCLLLRKVGKSNLENFEGLRQRLFPRLAHDFSASRGLLTFANGSRIVLGHYQCEKDIDSYLGLEYDVIGIEEATQLTLRKYEDISTCCRTSKTNWRPRLYSTTNPGDIGHQWYFEKFIVPFQSRTESTTRFIPARVDDNAFINPEYKVNLAARTGWQYNAWYKGDWNFPAGQYFKNFCPELHLLGLDPGERFKSSTGPALSPDFREELARLHRFRESDAVEWFAAMDYGYTHLTVVLLGCLDSADNLYVVDEHAERYWIPQRHAQAIKALLARHSIYSTEQHLRESLKARFPDTCTESNTLWYQLQSRMLSRFVAGTDMFGSESRGDSVAIQYRNLHLKLRPANMDRVSGWSAILQRLGDPAAGVLPSLFIHQRCQHLLECLPYVQHDPDRPGDVLKTSINEEGAGGDDAADALRYLVATKANTIQQRRLQGL